MTGTLACYLLVGGLWVVALYGSFLSAVTFCVGCLLDRLSRLLVVWFVGVGCWCFFASCVSYLVLSLLVLLVV